MFAGITVASTTYTTALADLENLIAVTAGGVTITLTTTGLVAGDTYYVFCDTSSGTLVKGQTGTINGSSSVSLALYSTTAATWGMFVWNGTNFYALLSLALS